MKPTHLSINEMTIITYNYYSLLYYQIVFIILNIKVSYPTMNDKNQIDFGNQAKAGIPAIHSIVYS